MKNTNTEPTGDGKQPFPAMMAKMPQRTKTFNQGQKVWLQQMSGACAALVTGKYRGNGRYVSGWIKWNGTTKPAPSWIDCNVSKDFATRHGLLRHNNK